VKAPDGRRDQGEPALDFLQINVDYLDGLHVLDVRERLVRFGKVESRYELTLIQSINKLME
jgi:hypothetical protein